MRDAPRRGRPAVRLSSLLVLSGSATALGSVLIFSALWALLTAASLRQETATAREESIQASRELIRSEAELAVRFIKSSRASTRARLETLVRDRVYEAHAVAAHLYREYRPRMDERQIGAAIKEALRPVRFNHGRGYYFAARLDGREELFADRPDLEGLNLLDLQDSEGRYVIRDLLRIARLQGEGFYNYTWTKPGQRAEATPSWPTSSCSSPWAG